MVGGNGEASTSPTNGDDTTNQGEGTDDSTTPTETTNGEDEEPSEPGLLKPEDLT